MVAWNHYLNTVILTVPYMWWKDKKLWNSVILRLLHFVLK